MKPLFQTTFDWIRGKDDHNLTLADSEDGYHFALWERGPWAASYRHARNDYPHHSIHLTIGRMDVIYVSRQTNPDDSYSYLFLFFTPA